MPKAIATTKRYQLALERAVASRQSRKYKTTQDLQEKIDEYFQEEDTPTVQGLQLHLGLNHSTWSEYAGWEDDYGLEPSSTLGSYSTVVENARLRLHAYLAKRLLNARYPVGFIFTLKNWYGWADETRQVVDRRSVQYVITLPAKQDADEWQEKHAAALQAPQDAQAIDRPVERPVVALTAQETAHVQDTDAIEQPVGPLSQSAPGGADRGGGADEYEHPPHSTNGQSRPPHTTTQQSGVERPPVSSPHAKPSERYLRKKVKEGGEEVHDAEVGTEAGEAVLERADQVIVGRGRTRSERYYRKARKRATAQQERLRAMRRGD